MKLQSFCIGQETHIGIETGDQVRLLKGVPTLIELIKKLEAVPAAQRSQAIEQLSGEVVDKAALIATAPIVEPVKDVICVGLNYQAHVNESQSLRITDNKEDIHTTYFGKRCDYIRGDQEPVIIWSDVDPEMDYEAELAIVIGKRGRGISRADALSYVFGYSIGNDLSSRSLQRNHKQWFLGKGSDGYTTMGPCVLVNTDDQTRQFDIKCSVNGQVRQESNTAMMIKSVEDIIYEISRAITLVPGDIIFTGTPAGVGGGFQPPKYLKAGDVVKIEIEGIGTLTNPVVAL
ncbi:MAG: fumarylacetoacetate hydrolase family protein [Clostridiaceae bacterium]